MTIYSLKYLADNIIVDGKVYDLKRDVTIGLYDTYVTLTIIPTHKQLKLTKTEYKKILKIDEIKNNKEN